MIAVAERSIIKPIGWMRAAGYAVAIGLVYYSALKQLIFNDWVKEDYSHCCLIPLVVIYFIWEKKNKLTSLPSKPTVWGFVPFFAGMALYWIGELGGEFYTMYFSLWLVILGLAITHLGWEKMRAILFAMVIMLAMFPFPDFITVRLSLYLQILSSWLGVWMLQLFDIPSYREGNVIDIGLTQLQVVEACSGLRYVIPILIVAMIMAYWYRAPLWKRIILLLSAPPLSIIFNSIRIAVTGILCSYAGLKAAEGFFHGFSGWLIFVMSIPVLLGEMRLLGSNKMERKKFDERNERHENRPATGNVKPVSRLLTPGRIYALMLLFLLTTFVASYGNELRKKIPIKRDFSLFPLNIGKWHGRRQILENEFISSLHFSEYFMAEYLNETGQQIEVYIAYYESQFKGQSAHTPLTCLPGNGWSYRDVGLKSLQMSDGAPIHVECNMLEKDGNRYLMYFWFPQRGRILVSLIQVKMYAFWDSLIRHRSDGALVRLITPVYPGEKVDDADKRLNGFATNIASELNAFLPE